MDERQKAILKRVEDELSSDGYKRIPIYEGDLSSNSFFLSYWDLIVDRKLAGLEAPTSQEIWEDMKKTINYLNRTAAKASEDYLRLQNKIRDLEEHIKWLEKDRK